MSEFDLELFYDKIDAGELVDTEKLRKYICSFRKVILWGCGNLGMEVLGLMRKLKCPVTAFWDKRYDALREIEGIPVLAPYTEDEGKDNTLIVYCISSVPTSPALWRELNSKGWKNILRGMSLYQGILCPLSIDKPFDASVCAKNQLCTLCNCEKMKNIMLYKKAQKEQVRQSELFCVDRVHFIINNFCNLKCKHCNRYMNSYPHEKKHNSDLQTIKYDIHRVLSAIDSVAVGIVFGGEPFLHPHLDEITGQLLREENLGTVLINSNGLAGMNGRTLENMKDSRVRVAFSNYTHVLSAEQQKRFWENAEYLRKNGVEPQLQNTVPTWAMPSDMTYKGSNKEECIRKRKNCDFPYLFVYEHKVFPCIYSMTWYDLGIMDDPRNYINILDYKDDKSLGIAIRNLKEETYFKSCAFCADEEAMPVKSAEQGFDERYALPNRESR